MGLALFLELLPGLAVAQLPLAHDDEPLPRVPVYLSSVVLILGMGVFGLLVGRHEVGLELMGLQSRPAGFLVAWSLGLTAMVLAIMGGFFLFRRRAGLRETPLMAQLLPRTSGEKGIFVFLSLSAGAGEEVAYRGFLIPALTLAIGSVWGAAVLSSVVFGLLHAYQGWLGIVRTAVIGMVFAVAFIVTDCLWPAMAAHAILDILAGLVLGDVLMKE
jgi:membrane protease YdiL (CAAX protease family)